MIENSSIKIIRKLQEVIPRKTTKSIEEPHSIRNSYICSNPSGSVSNIDCPDDDLLCNCPCRKQEETDGAEESSDLVLFPRVESIESLFELLLYENQSEDGAALRQKVVEAIADGNKYAIIKNDPLDDSDDSTYPIPNIIADEFYQTLEEARTAYNLLDEVYNEPTRSELNELLKNTKECEKIEEVLGAEYLGCVWEDPNSPISCKCPCMGEKFMDYIKYTRTNASFWNTPHNTPLWRAAQTALLRTQQIVITVSGDLSIRPGDIVNLDVVEIPNLDPLDIPETSHKLSTMEKNAKFNGKWLVNSITHKIVSTNLHKMDLTLIRDSLPIDNTTEDEEEPLTEESQELESTIPVLTSSSAFAVRGTDANYSKVRGWYYPLYTTIPDGEYHTHTFSEYPNVDFYMPDGIMNHAVSSKPDGYVVYNEEAQESEEETDDSTLINEEQEEVVETETTDTETTDTTDTETTDTTDTETTDTTDADSGSSYGY